MCCKLFSEYLGSKEIAKIDTWFVRLIEEPRIVLVGRMEALLISGEENLFDLLFLLGAWKMGREGLDKAVETWSLWKHTRSLIADTLMILKKTIQMS